MNEFMMLFRHIPTPDITPSQEEIQAEIKKWQDWIGGLAAQGKFVSTSQLDQVGKTLKPGNIITDGPYAEVKEIVGGYLIIKAENLEEAVKLAEECPMLESPTGHVEIRKILNFEF